MNAGSSKRALVSLSWSIASRRMTISAFAVWISPRCCHQACNADVYDATSSSTTDSRTTALVVNRGASRPRGVAGRLRPVPTGRRLAVEDPPGRRDDDRPGPREDAIGLEDQPRER